MFPISQEMTLIILLLITIERLNAITQHHKSVPMMKSLTYRRVGTSGGVYARNNKLLDGSLLKVSMQSPTRPRKGAIQILLKDPFSTYGSYPIERGGSSSICIELGIRIISIESFYVRMYFPRNPRAGRNPNNGAKLTLAKVLH
jgi:hypothetical protein